MPAFTAPDSRVLLLMRHAKSGWDNPGISDHDRPLDERGERDAPRMGRLLSQLKIRPMLIVSSTARRARDTAQHVAEGCAYEHEILFEPRLYHATPTDWRAVLRDLPDEKSRVLCVGHNPGLEELLRRWSGAAVEMPTGSVAVAEVSPSAWSEYDRTDVTVSAVYRPREIDDAAQA